MASGSRLGFPNDLRNHRKIYRWAVFEIVKDRVRAATQYLPEMIQAALTEEIESGNTRKVLMQRVSTSIKQQKKGTPLQGAMGGLSKFLPKKIDTTPLLPSVDEEKDQ